MESHELKSFVSVTGKPVARDRRVVKENDNAHLQRIGKNPVLKVHIQNTFTSNKTNKAC